MRQGNGFAEEDPAENKIEDRGDLNKNAEIGRVVELESLVVGDAGEAGKEPGSNEKEKDCGGRIVKIETADEAEDGGDAEESDAEKEFLGDGEAALEVAVGDVVVDIDTRGI